MIFVVTFEMRTVAKSVYSIDDQTQNQIVFYSRNGKRGKWQDSGETERESKGESASIGRRQM